MNKILYISDFFLDTIQGGGELVDDCLINNLIERGYDVQRVHCGNATPEFIDNNSAAFFIVSNFVTLSEESKESLGAQSYVIYEHDHKYIIERNPSAYKNFEVPSHRLANLSFYRNAKAVFSQSKLHSEVIGKNVKGANVINLGCTLWSDEHLRALENNLDTQKDDKFAIVNSENPVKGRDPAIAYCRNKNVSFDLIGSNDYKEFIAQLAAKKGLVFFSQVLESFCRLVVEARVLDCTITTNNLNGCASEEWFKNYKGKELLNFLKEKKKEVIDTIISVIKGDHRSNKKGDITVILNSYRRPYNLNMQVEAIKNQTILPKETWLWVNSHEDNKGWDYSNLGIDKVFNNDHNWKFYGRFAAALLADTEYVAVFDDDTIPGKEWFENCLKTMETHEGILGSAGVILNGKHYVQHNRCGWPSQNKEATEVDLVGHAWFFKRDWLQYLWKEKPTTWDNGEDIQFSYLAQKYGDIKTYCPPHPLEKPELHGSILGNELGIDNKATSTDSSISHERFFAERDVCVQTAIKNGWKTVNGVSL